MLNVNGVALASAGQEATPIREALIWYWNARGELVWNYDILEWLCILFVCGLVLSKGHLLCRFTFHQNAKLKPFSFKISNLSSIFFLCGQVAPNSLSKSSSHTSVPLSSSPLPSSVSHYQTCEVTTCTLLVFLEEVQTSAGTNMKYSAHTHTHTHTHTHRHTPSHPHQTPGPHLHSPLSSPLIAYAQMQMPIN